MVRWKVLLIGGASGLGKSTAARVVARETNATLCEVDDIRMALQTITTAAEQPALHFFIKAPGVAREKIWALPPQQLCEGLIGVGQIVSRALEVVVSHHVACDKRVVIEGDGLLPAFAARWQSANLEVGNRVKAVFLTMTENYFSSRVSREPSPLMTERLAQARLNWLFSQWLSQESERFGLTCLPDQPWESLPGRILAAAEGTEEAR
jgi:2-phosphoglycerate kinase